MLWIGYIQVNLWSEGFYLNNKLTSDSNIGFPFYAKNCFSSYNMIFMIDLAKNIMGNMCDKGLLVSGNIGVINLFSDSVH